MDNENKKPEVIIGKSALDEVLEEWNAWRGKSKAKKVEREANLSTADRIRKKRKQHTNFMDSGFMLVIKFFAGIVDFIFSIIMWFFSLIFSFKFWAFVGIIIYFSDYEVDISNILDDHDVKEQVIELREKAEATFIELKDGFEGLEIEIKKTDGTVIKFGGGDDVDIWYTEELPTELPTELPKEEATNE